MVSGIPLGLGLRARKYDPSVYVVLGSWGLYNLLGPAAAKAKKRIHIGRTLGFGCRSLILIDRCRYPSPPPMQSWLHESPTRMGPGFRYLYQETRQKPIGSRMKTGARASDPNKNGLQAWCPWPPVEPTVNQTFLSVSL